MEQNEEIEDSGGEGTRVRKKEKMYKNKSPEPTGMISQSRDAAVITNPKLGDNSSTLKIG